MTRAEVIVVGAGLAGLSAAIYLGRASRETLVIDSGKSMARWEPSVENYLGFPDGVRGEDLLRLGRKQARRFGARFVRDRIQTATLSRGSFQLQGGKGRYQTSRLLLATGIFHIPPDLPCVRPSIGHSLFFCKDCDGYRVRGKRIAVYGWKDEAVEYALGMLSYSPRVVIVTDGRAPRWSRRHAAWLREYGILVRREKIIAVQTDESLLRAFEFEKGGHEDVDALFTTRGDVCHNRLAARLGARLNAEGEVVVDVQMRTSVRGLYAAGCVTPANCQMIIAAGQGATAAQAIHRDLFEESLAKHSLRRS